MYDGLKYERNIMNTCDICLNPNKYTHKGNLFGKQAKMIACEISDKIHLITKQEQLEIMEKKRLAGREKIISEIGEEELNKRARQELSTALSKMYWESRGVCLKCHHCETCESSGKSCFSRYDNPKCIQTDDCKEK